MRKRRDWDRYVVMAVLTIHLVLMNQRSAEAPVKTEPSPPAGETNTFVLLRYLTASSEIL
jgi:hypothetical protein